MRTFSTCWFSWCCRHGFPRVASLQIAFFRFFCIFCIVRWCFGQLWAKFWLFACSICSSCHGFETNLWLEDSKWHINTVMSLKIVVSYMVPGSFNFDNRAFSSLIICIVFHLLHPLLSMPPAETNRRNLVANFCDGCQRQFASRFAYDQHRRSPWNRGNPCSSMQHRELIASRRSDVSTAMLRSSSGGVYGASKCVQAEWWAIISRIRAMHFIDPCHKNRI